MKINPDINKGPYCPVVLNKETPMIETRNHCQELLEAHENHNESKIISIMRSICHEQGIALLPNLTEEQKPAARSFHSAY